jgi:hypothetical protein
VVLAQGLQVVVGLVIASPLTLWKPIREVLPYSWLWCGVFIAAGALCIYPPVLGKIVNLVLGRIGHPPLTSRPRLSDYLTPIAFIAVQWILSGFALWLVAYSLVPMKLDSLPLFISASALANVSGYLAFFAPAGLGIRELVLIATLEYLLGGSPVAILAVMMRLAYTMAECLLALAGFYARSRWKKALNA